MCFLVPRQAPKDALPAHEGFHTMPRFVVLLASGFCLAIGSAACGTAAAPTRDALPIELDSQLGERAWPGEQEATQSIAEAIAMKIESAHAAGERPARRDAHPKAHGCVRATFEVEATLAPELAYGMFQPGARHPAWIRFSNGASDPARPDGEGDARGMAIKLMGVPGPKLVADESGTQDFILINHPVFFIDDPLRYAAFFQRLNSSNPLVRLSAPLALGMRGLLIAREIGASQIANPLFEQYFTMVPYQLGVDASKRAVKYSARPCHPRENGPDPDAAQDPDSLRKAMRATLGQGDACFEFLVQPRTSSSMSVERSTIEWNESEAPFRRVAVLSIPQQTFDRPAQDEFCENLSFSPWHARTDQRPLGGVNRVRRVVYDTISRTRHELNGAPRHEPTGDETF